MARPVKAQPHAPHPQYFAVKAAELEFLLARQTLHAQLQAEMEQEFAERFKIALDRLIAKRAAAFKAAGLDSSKNWRLDDVAQAIVEATTP